MTLESRQNIPTEIIRSEINRIRELAKTDLLWWKKHLIHDTEQAVQTGLLIEIPIESTNFRLIRPLRDGSEERLLNPIATAFLISITDEWKKALLLIDPSCRDDRLSITSLYRSPILQKKLVESKANAAIVSAHQAGACIDFDPTAYYQGEERRPINMKMDDYNTAHIQILRGILREKHIRGECNFIEELSFTATPEENIQKYSSCYHVCVAPAVMET